MQAPVNLLAPDPGLFWVSLVVLGLMVAIPLYLLVRFLRAYERRSRSAREAPSQAAVIEALEDEVAALRTNVAQLTDAQDFTTNLLRARPTPAGETTSVLPGTETPPHNNAATPHDNQR